MRDLEESGRVTTKLKRSRATADIFSKTKENFKVSNPWSNFSKYALVNDIPQRQNPPDWMNPNKFKD